jgi:hypothetical protein
MALLFMDGFDHFLTADASKKGWTINSNTINPTAGRRGGGALAFGSSLFTSSKPFPANLQTVVVGCAYNPFVLGSSAFLSLVDGSTQQVTVGANSDGSLKVFRGANNGTLLGQTAPALYVPGAYFYLEVKAKIDPTVGTVELRINGVSVLSLSGVNTRSTANSYVNQLYVVSQGSGSFLDDLYVCDISGTKNNDFLGDSRVDPLLPNADGTYSQFTPSTGTSHFALVDETTPNTTDYNDGLTVGNRDSYQFTNLASLASQIIYGVQANAAVLKDDAGAKSICTFVRSGTTDSDAATAVLGTSQTYVSQIFETNPSGGVAWTEASVNAAEFGVKVTA